MDMVLVGMYFELIVLLVASILIALVLLKYITMKNRLTLCLLLIFIFYVLTLVFSIFSKIIVLTTDYDYVYNQPSGYPQSPYSWLILRIVDFRISLCFAAIGVLFSYILKVFLYEEKVSSIQKIFIAAFAGFTVLFSFFAYQRGNTLLDALNFLFMMLFMVIVFIPFMLKCLKSYKTAPIAQLRGRFLSLALMSLSFLLIVIMFLIDRITILLGMSSGFTVFYFMKWLLALFGIACAYFGFIKPD